MNNLQQHIPTFWGYSFLSKWELNVGDFSIPSNSLPALSYVFCIIFAHTFVLFTIFLTLTPLPWYVIFYHSGSLTNGTHSVGQQVNLKTHSPVASHTGDFMLDTI